MLTICTHACASVLELNQSSIVLDYFHPHTVVVPLPPPVLANASCPRQSQVRHDELSLAQRAHHRPCLNHSVAPARTDQLSVLAVPLISRNSISRAALVKQVWTRFHPLSYTYPMAPNSIASDLEILHVRRIRTWSCITYACIHLIAWLVLLSIFCYFDSHRPPRHPEGENNVTVGVVLVSILPNPLRNNKKYHPLHNMCTSRCLPIHVRGT